MSKQWIALLAGALVIALVVGCGDSSEGETNAKSLAKPVYVKKVTAICEKTNKQVKVGFEEFTADQGSAAFEDLDSMEEYLDTFMIPAKQQEIEELQALGAPVGDEEETEAIIEGFEEGIEAAEDDPERAVQSTFGVFARANDLANDYGADNCYG